MTITMPGGVSAVVVAVDAMFSDLNRSQAEGPSEGSKRKAKLFPDGFPLQVQRQNRVPAHRGQTCQKDCLL